MRGVRNYRAEHSCGQTCTPSLNKVFVWACFLFLPDTMLHVSFAYLTLKAHGGFSAVCVCEREHTVEIPTTTSLAYNLLIYQCLVRGPYVLIKSNLIQMLHPHSAPTRHQPIKQALSTPPLWFKIGQSFTLPINYELDSQQRKAKTKKSNFHNYKVKKAQIKRSHYSYPRLPIRFQCSLLGAERNTLKRNS